MQIVIVLLEYKVEGDRTDTEGCSRDGVEADSRNFVLNAMCYW